MRSQKIVDFIVSLAHSHVPSSGPCFWVVFPTLPSCPKPESPRLAFGHPVQPFRTPFGSGSLQLAHLSQTQIRQSFRGLELPREWVSSALACLRSRSLGASPAPPRPASFGSAHRRTSPATWFTCFVQVSVCGSGSVLNATGGSWFSGSAREGGFCFFWLVEADNRWVLVGHRRDDA